jgi:hypothetical protein
MTKSSTPLRAPVREGLPTQRPRPCPQGLADVAGEAAARWVCAQGACRTPSADWIGSRWQRPFP